MANKVKVLAMVVFAILAIATGPAGVLVAAVVLAIAGMEEA